ncbi:KEOPS complex subunit Pcc1 [Haloarchaeobius amylolyticus]|uniref:KEOPS complex subunit Pcc1 n=1 Tax=Haloarchaeobius amylolyticus TaxID=1198296 RepID=A0ABD6BH10_9EURY
MSRHATIRTDHDDATVVARALRPDNTDEMETTVERDGETATIVTHIERETTSGLQSTVDDYVANLEVAIGVVSQARTVQGDQPTDTGAVSDPDSDSTHDTQ